MEEVGAELARRLDAARQHLAAAYEWARHTGYTPDSPPAAQCATTPARHGIKSPRKGVVDSATRATTVRR